MYRLKKLSNQSKKDAIRYAEITIRALHPYGVYILKDTRSKYINSGEWERFVFNLTADLSEIVDIGVC